MAWIQLIQLMKRLLLNIPPWSWLNDRFIKRVNVVQSVLSLILNEMGLGN